MFEYVIIFQVCGLNFFYLICDINFGGCGIYKKWNIISRDRQVIRDKSLVLVYFLFFCLMLQDQLLCYVFFFKDGLFFFCYNGLKLFEIRS